MVTNIKVFLVICLAAVIIGWPGVSTAVPGDIFVSGINDVRTQQELNPLAIDVELTILATEWSMNMAKNGAISHSDLSTGITSNWSRLGENVGVGPDVASVQQALLNSPAHKANILGEFTFVGVGTFESAGKLWVTEKFMSVFPSVVPPPKTTQPAPPPTTLPKPIITTPPTTIPPTTVPPPTTTVTRPPVFIEATIPDKAIGPVLPTIATIRLTLRQWLSVLLAKWRQGWVPTFA